MISIVLIIVGLVRPCKNSLGTTNKFVKTVHQEFASPFMVKCKTYDCGFVLK